MFALARNEDIHHVLCTHFPFPLFLLVKPYLKPSYLFPVKKQMYITFKQQDLVGWLMYSRKKNLKMPKGGNQNPYIEQEQTTKWPKEKV